MSIRGWSVGGCGQRPSLGPARDLPFDEPVRSPEIGEVDGDRVDLVEVGKSVDHGEPDPTADIAVVLHRRRDGPPDHDARAVLEDHEVRPHHGVIVAEGVRAGARRGRAPQP